MIVKSKDGQAMLNAQSRRVTVNESGQPEIVEALALIGLYFLTRFARLCQALEARAIQEECLCLSPPRAPLVNHEPLLLDNPWDQSDTTVDSRSRLHLNRPYNLIWEDQGVRNACLKPKAPSLKNLATRALADLASARAYEHEYATVPNISLLDLYPS